MGEIIKEKVMGNIKNIEIELIVVNGFNIFGIYDYNIFLRLNLGIFGELENSNIVVIICDMIYGGF